MFIQYRDAFRILIGTSPPTNQACFLVFSLILNVVWPNHQVIPIGGKEIIHHLTRLDVRNRINGVFQQLLAQCLAYLSYESFGGQMTIDDVVRSE